MYCSCGVLIDGFRGDYSALTVFILISTNRWEYLSQSRNDRGFLVSLMHYQGITMNRIDLWKLLLLVLPMSLTLSMKALAEDAPEAPEPATEEVAEEASEADEESDDGEGQEEEEEKPTTIAELTEEMDRIDGLFTMFRDPKTGATKMLLQDDQLDSEFIYFKHTMNGVTDAGAF
ncbi:MAG: hypothetical protein DWQ28_00135, partial [Proteobacteria bacterium]